jgi:hypothetical protein
MDKTVLYEFLAHHRYGVVSSVSATGVPQSALVGIAVTQQLDIIFDTVKTTRKYPNLIACPDCSLVVGWENEQTVQLEGTAFEPQGEELVSYQEAYFSVWPDGRARVSWPGITWLVVHPDWIRYSNFSQSPPGIEEVRLKTPS